MTTKLYFAIALILLPGLLVAQAPATPSAEHKLLDQSVGVWDAEIAIIRPDNPPMRYKGVETIKKMGEFWTVIDYQFEFMKTKAQSHGTIGYDPQKKKFIGTWHESTNPYLATLEGTYDKESNAFHYVMQSKNMTGDVVVYKIVFTQTSPDIRTFELFAKIDGTDEMTKLVETKYTRRR